jgi:hypothetical protein
MLFVRKNSEARLMMLLHLLLLLQQVSCSTRDCCTTQYIICRQFIRSTTTLPLHLPSCSKRLPLIYTIYKAHPINSSLALIRTLESDSLRHLVPLGVPLQRARVDIWLSETCYSTTTSLLQILDSTRCTESVSLWPLYILIYLGSCSVHSSDAVSLT